MTPLSLGKLPPKFLDQLLRYIADSTDPRVYQGPGIGLDCAVLDFGNRFVVVKSDPITFATDSIGWYAVNVNANDIATTGARPRWFLATLLLPVSTEKKTVETIFGQIKTACQEVGASLIGGHTELTAGLDRPIIAGTMLGEIDRECLISPSGAKPGDHILLTKGIPIEATSILAREFPARLSSLPNSVVERAAEYLHNPGISIVPEAMAAAEVGGVTAMHDPTEGGLAAALWELAQASQVRLVIDVEAIPIPQESRMVCDALSINPLEAIASGALLLTVDPKSVSLVLKAIGDLDITVVDIGSVEPGRDVLILRQGNSSRLNWPLRDAIAQLFEKP